MLLSEGFGPEISTIISAISLGYGSASCKCRSIGDIKHDPASNLDGCQASTDVRCRTPYESIIFFLNHYTAATGTADISCDKIGIIVISTLIRVVIVVFASEEK